MYSVTQRIKAVKQPRGGYLPPKAFTNYTRSDDTELAASENLPPSIVGTAVDYLTRFMMDTPAKDAFRISLKGAEKVNKSAYAHALLTSITGLDDFSITNACQLVGYDVCARAGIAGYAPVQTICPDKDTIDNIRTMVNRCLSFWKEEGPILMAGFTFEGGYTDIVSSGDGDYLTMDTLWDLKTSKNKPTSQQTLQLLVYYIMGKNSIHWEFHDINQLGIFNPRLNTVHLLKTKDIDKNVIEQVSVDVIGYSRF